LIAVFSVLLLLVVFWIAWCGTALFRCGSVLRGAAASAGGTGVLGTG